MKHAVSTRKELTILKIEEEVFDFRHGTAFRGVIAALVEKGSTNIMVDFSQVKAIDSGGIGSMLHAHQMTNEAHGLAIFVSLCQQIKDLLKLTNLDKQLYIFSSINEVMTLIEPAMKARRNSAKKSAAYDPDEGDMDDMDIISEGGIVPEDDMDDFGNGEDDEEDEDPENQQDENDDEDEEEKPVAAKKRGRPKSTAQTQPAPKKKKQ